VGLPRPHQEGVGSGRIWQKPAGCFQKVRHLPHQQGPGSPAELPELDQAGAEARGGPSSGNTDLYPCGSWVVAVYKAGWYVAQVEGEELEEEEGYTQLNYMEMCGFNQFRWAKKKDVLKTKKSDILLKIDPPIPVSSRHMGLPKNLVSKVYHLFRVQWLFICWNLYLRYFSLFSFEKMSYSYFWY
jgi:hypothetical protein